METTKLLQVFVSVDFFPTSPRMRITSLSCDLRWRFRHHELMMTAAAAQDRILLVIFSAAATLKRDLYFFNKSNILHSWYKNHQVEQSEASFVAFLCEWADVSALTVWAKHWAPAVVQSLSRCSSRLLSESLQETTDQLFYHLSS